MPLQYRVQGPYFSHQVQQAFLQGKLCLESRVRMVGHVAFKPLMAYWHILDEALSESRRAESARRSAAAAAQAAERRRAAQEQAAQQAAEAAGAGTGTGMALAAGTGQGEDAV